MGEEKKNNENRLRNVNTFLTVFLSLAALFFIYQTYHNPQHFQLFHKTSFQSAKEKIQIVSQLALTWALIIMCLTLLHYKLIRFFDFDEQSYLLREIKKTTGTCLLHSFIILSFFTYILAHGKFGLTENEILLFAHWSFVGVISTAVGSLIRAKTNFNFKEFGYTMIGFVEVGMLAQVHGYQPLNYL